MRFLPFMCVVLLLIILSILGFAPNIHIKISDKLLHFIGFFILTVAIYFTWDRNIKWNAVVTGTLSLSASLISEVIQGFLPANFLGSSLGLVLSIFGDWIRNRFAIYGKYKQVDCENFDENTDIPLT
ncbi:hypothetical protein RirG_064150 [Rhizophagus irregularis DAOM 197198w]|uniref:VanZ-like domain-containing protein n=1 Tax=Rhizophagus irregularis (strain DAOM 197198w) TaxID=1432141 RepID=A0A015KZI9_RHIIW|nr:hypothetical protein RirG_064150 [Rhizophagus irregularis DAOM 197198w]